VFKQIINNFTKIKKTNYKTMSTTEKKDALSLVTNVVKNYQEAGELAFPENYSPTNNLKTAWLVLQESVDKDNKPVLEACSQKSVVNSLLKMVTLGLSVVKNQCYFVAYAGKLECVVSYEGNTAIAKRHGVKHVVANTIFEKDEFEFEVDLETGLKRITKHKQSIDTIDPKNFKGAYALVTMEDGRKELTVMTKTQIIQAWNQRKGNGLSPAHTNFGDRMAEKTVINRALAHIIRSSDDSDLMDVNQERPNQIPLPQNLPVVDFDHHEEIKAIENKPVEVVPEKPKKEKVEAVPVTSKKEASLFQDEKDPF
jgi:recombination protein RecT